MGKGSSFWGRWVAMKLTDSGSALFSLTIVSCERLVCGLRKRMAGAGWMYLVNQHHHRD